MCAPTVFASRCLELLLVVGSPGTDHVRIGAKQMHEKILGQESCTKVDSGT